MRAAARVTIGNLPVEVAGFVGRRQEIGEVERLLEVSRLVTLTGVGGTGKTRLALKVAAELGRAFADGVWFADLTQLQAPELLPEGVQDPEVMAFLVAGTLGLRSHGGGAPVQALVEQLAGRQLLLILDNCEHLTPASAILAAALLRGCPDLRILATSREPLAISGEVIYAVPPLPAPDPRQRLSPAEVSRYEAVALFLARAEAVASGFGLTTDNHLAVAELCHRLDGLPLAIELAAARTVVLAPQQILDRLADGFTLLSRGSRCVPERQQTLRACVDWSFDLCAKPEQVLWARLSVFAGGFEPDAVEGICADEVLPRADLPELMAGLVHKSILVRDDLPDGRGRARYRMVMTIHGYGLERLRELGQVAVLRRRHRDWYQELLVRARAEWVSDRQAYWMARLRREHANLRAAVEFCLTEPGEAPAALRLAASLPRSYWPGPGLAEGRRWLDRVLAQATAPTALRARALLISSQLALWQDDAAAARPLLDAGEELARSLDAGAELAYAALIRGMGALFANDLPTAVETLHRSWTTLSGEPDPDPDLYMPMLSTFCAAAGLAGDQERAITAQQEMVAVSERRDASRHRSLALWVGGLLAWIRGDLREAAAQELEALRSKRAWGSDDEYGIVLCLEVLAWITSDQRRHRRAATLLGAADALWTALGIPITAFGHFIGHRAACEGHLRGALGDAAFAECFAHGRDLDLGGALAYALEEPRRPVPAPHWVAPTSLTRREREVADLIAQGLSNKDIAAGLVVSRRTAEGHVQRILAKLGLTSRTQLVTWVADRRSGTGRGP